MTVDRKDPDNKLDALLSLMDKHKPHLKPYTRRLQSWNAMLVEYNTVTGAKFKQPRTMRRRFEKLMESYQVDKHSVKCSDRSLLKRLIAEYNIPYRVLQKEVEEEKYRRKMNMPIPHDKIQIEVPILAQDLREEEEEEKEKEDQESQQEPNELTPKLPKKYCFANGLAITPIDESTDSRKQSSTPPPLDTITLGMPRNSYFDSSQPTTQDSVDQTAPSSLPAASKVNKTVTSNARIDETLILLNKTTQELADVKNLFYEYKKQQDLINAEILDKLNALVSTFQPEAITSNRSVDEDSESSTDEE